MPGMERMDQHQEVNTSGYPEGLPIEVKIVTHNPERGTLATAEVKMADLITIRNVKIREDDYGLNIVMPRTKMPFSEQFKDSVFFASKELREQFDMAVTKAYLQEMGFGMEDELEEDMEGEMEEELEEDIAEVMDPDMETDTGILEGEPEGSMEEETVDGMTMAPEM